MLKFTPLEFETLRQILIRHSRIQLKFTPLEFETPAYPCANVRTTVKIYSVGV